MKGGAMALRTFGHTSTGNWTPHGAFQAIVAPALMAAGLLPRGQLVSAEGTSQDARAGIDWIISGADGTQTTLAARVQWHRDYGTLTTRYRTERGSMSELTKRYRSILAGGSYPTLTVQAYVTQPGGVLINAYVIRTEDLYRHIIHPSTDGDPEHFTLCGCAGEPTWAPGGAQFIAIAISEDGKAKAKTKSTLVACGVPFRSFQPINAGGGLWT
jgi:hypothetical protein